MNRQTLGFSRSAAWKRLWSKLVDLSIGLITFFGIFILIIIIARLVNENLTNNLLSSLSNINPPLDRIVSMFIMFITCSVIIPIQTSYFGNTVGKKLLGIQIRKRNGDNLSLKESSLREIKVFLRGLFFLWFSILYQYFVFKRNGILSWDEEMDLVVSYQEYSFSSIAIRFIICIFIWIGTLLLFTLISTL